MYTEKFYVWHGMNAEGVRDRVREIGEFEKKNCFLRKNILFIKGENS